jgi:hypothetical protein
MFWICGVEFSYAYRSSYKNPGTSFRSSIETNTSGKDKVKVKLSLCLNWTPRHEGVLGEWRYSSIHSLTSTLDGGEWVAPRSGRLTPRGRVLGTHWTGGWVGPRSVLEAVMKRKIPSPRRESKPRTPIFQPVAQRYSDWAITALSSGKRAMRKMLWEKLFLRPLFSNQVQIVQTRKLTSFSQNIKAVRKWKWQLFWI